MKVVIQDDEGKELSLLVTPTIIPEGCTLLICPANKDTFMPTQVALLLGRQLEAWGIRALVCEIPVCVWAVTSDAA